MDGDDDLFPAIETERLRLRSVRPADAPAMCALITPAISRWLAAWPYPFSPDLALERLAATREAVAQKRALTCAIERRSEPGFIGWISVLRISPADRSAMLGYWLGEAHQGRGYMREAGPAMLGAAFAHLNLDLIEAAVQPENEASASVLRGCGMRSAGERMIFAPARGRDELCRIYAVRREQHRHSLAGSDDGIRRA